MVTPVGTGSTVPTTTTSVNFNDTLQAGMAMLQEQKVEGMKSRIVENESAKERIKQTALQGTIRNFV